MKSVPNRVTHAKSIAISGKSRAAVLPGVNAGTFHCRISMIALAVAGAFVPAIVHALPTGSQVVSGNVSFSVPSSTTMNVNQASNKAIVNWNSFSVGSGETVNFLQPGAGFSAEGFQILCHSSSPKPSPGGRGRGPLGVSRVGG